MFKAMTNSRDVTDNDLHGAMNIDASMRARADELLSESRKAYANEKASISVGGCSGAAAAETKVESAVVVVDHVIMRDWVLNSTDDNSNEVAHVPTPRPKVDDSSELEATDQKVTDQQKDAMTEVITLIIKRVGLSLEQEQKFQIDIIAFVEVLVKVRGVLNESNIAKVIRQLGMSATNCTEFFVFDLLDGRYSLHKQGYV